MLEILAYTAVGVGVGYGLYYGVERLIEFKRNLDKFRNNIGK